MKTEEEGVLGFYHKQSDFNEFICFGEDTKLSSFYAIVRVA